MAGEQQAKNDFNSILTNLERKFDIMHVKWTDDQFFEVKFRTQIQRTSDDFNALCDDWVDLFSNVTSTVWVKKISNTGPKIRFRKQYQCWTQGGKEVKKELLFDARRCKGTLDIKVLTDNPLTRRKNKHIRLGLNVVVKINFNHLHKVITNQSYAFFVHPCEPLQEVPKVIINTDAEKLSQRVAEMVQKGLNASPKVVNPNLLISKPHVHIENDPLLLNDLQNKILEEDISNKLIQDVAEIQSDIQQKTLDNTQILQQMLNMEQIQLNQMQMLPLQGTGDTIKLQVQPQLQHFTQVVVSSPQLDMSEPLLMCQPALMFDPTQVIHPISHHFVQLHSHNIPNQQGHYL